MFEKSTVSQEMEMLKKASAGLVGGMGCETTLGYAPKCNTKDVVQELEFLAEEHVRIDAKVKELLSRLMPLRRLLPKGQPNEANKVAETSKMASFVRGQRMIVGTLNELLDECLQDLQI